jgi:hypothetical protein
MTSSLDDRLKAIELWPVRGDDRKRTYDDISLSDSDIALIKLQFRKSGYIHSPTFMTELETRLQALDLTTLRKEHDHEADDWVKEVLLDTVRRSLKDA